MVLRVILSAEQKEPEKKAHFYDHLPLIFNEM